MAEIGISSNEAKNSRAAVVLTDDDIEAIMSRAAEDGKPGGKPAFKAVARSGRQVKL